MTVSLLYALVGAALLVVSVALWWPTRNDLPEPTDTTGYTPEQVRLARRDAYAGRLPEDPSQSALAVRIAAYRLETLLPRRRFLPTVALGAILLGASTGEVFTPAVAQLLTVSFVAGTVVGSFRFAFAVVNSRRVIELDRTR